MQVRLGQKIISYLKGFFINSKVCSILESKELPKGAIIGSVVIAGCVQNHPSLWAEKGCWNWVLKDPVLFENPIMNEKGKLNFWDYDMNRKYFLDQ